MIQTSDIPGCKTVTTLCMYWSGTPDMLMTMSSACPSASHREVAKTTTERKVDPPLRRSFSFGTITNRIEPREMEERNKRGRHFLVGIRLYRTTNVLTTTIFLPRLSHTRVNLRTIVNQSLTFLFATDVFRSTTVGLRRANMPSYHYWVSPRTRHHRPVSRLGITEDLQMPSRYIPPGYMQPYSPC